jgi:hypothetical protein
MGYDQERGSIYRRSGYERSMMDEKNEVEFRKKSDQAIECSKAVAEVLRVMNDEKKNRTGKEGKNNGGGLAPFSIFRFFSPLDMSINEV